MELGFSPPVFLPCRLISTANCKNATTPLSPIRWKRRGGKRGELARNQGGIRLIIHGQFSVPLTRLAALTHSEARCGQTWQVGELTGKLGVQEACSLSVSLSWSRGGGEFWTSYRGLVYFVGNVRSLFLVPLLIVRRRIVLRVSKLVQRILGTGRIREDSLWRYNETLY